MREKSAAVKALTAINVVKLPALAKRHCKSHPSEARILTRATTCPWLGFLERAFPITRQHLINFKTQIIEHPHLNILHMIFESQPF